MIDLLFDCLRVAHMASFAVGIGAAAFLELYLAKRFRDRLDTEAVKMLLQGHELIKYAVVGLWATGLSLLYCRLVIFADPFTAKLAAKLSVVTALSVNMFIIEKFLIPRVVKYQNQRLSDVKPRTLGLFGGIAGFSAGAWFSALILGGIGQLKSMDVAHLSGLLLPLLAVATLIGVVSGLVFASGGVFGARHRMAQGN